MAENKLEENEVKEVKKRGRGRPRKEESTNNETPKKVETKKKTTTTSKKEEKTTTTQKTTAKKKNTSTKKVDVKTEETKISKTPKAKTTTKTSTKKETTPKKTRTTKNKAEELEKKSEKIEAVLNKNKEEKELVVKKDISIDEEKLETIEKEINKQTKIPNEEKKKINKKIFQNIVMAIGIIIYFIFINLGFSNIEKNTYLTDLKVFSVVTIGITIILFEKAYKKDSGEITICGIEMLTISICTLLTSYVYKICNKKFIYIFTSVAMLFAVYYVGKSIVIYVKMKNKALKKASDIHKIVRK